MSHGADFPAAGGDCGEAVSIACSVAGLFRSEDEHYRRHWKNFVSSLQEAVVSRGSRFYLRRITSHIVPRREGAPLPSWMDEDRTEKKIFLAVEE